VTAKLWILSHAATTATRAGAFPYDEAIEDGQAAGIAALAGRLPHFDRILTSPARAAMDTALALGLAAEAEAALDDADFGHWRGRTITNILAENPEDVALWRTAPEAAPHGGESIAAVIERVGSWLDGAGLTRNVLAITHAAVMRAVIIHVLAAPPSSFWAIDAGPLTLLELSHDGRRWALRCPPL
jgi:broad specificity phosphatase PhoE